jgi:membrane protein
MPQVHKIRKIAQRGAKFVQEMVQGFIDDDCMDISAALSYYMALSLAPILFVLVLVAGGLFGEQAISGKIYAQTVELIGERAAEIVQGLLQNAYHGSDSWWATVASVFTFVLGATTVFAVLHTSLNKIWRVAPRQRRAFAVILRQRLLGLLILTLIGILLVATIIAEQVLEIIAQRFTFLLPKLPELLVNLPGQAITYAILLCLFTLVFKFLSDAQLRWFTTLAGGAFTTGLFAIGKVAIGFYLLRSGLGGVYGAAGSFVVLLTWIYYSAAIFLLGAEFIKVYASRVNDNLSLRD